MVTGFVRTLIVKELNIWPPVNFQRENHEVVEVWNKAAF